MNGDDFNTYFRGAVFAAIATFVMMLGVLSVMACIASLFR